MKKIAMFLSLSFAYWKKHIKRISTLAAVCILGAAALCFSCLYIRSEKTLVMEENLTLQGDYDVVVYGMEEKDLSFISENEDVSSYGFYRELGYAGAGGDSQYKVASFPNGNSAKMYHMTCIQGGYPENDNEIAIDADTAKKMGIEPMPGQKLTLTLHNMENQKLEKREYTISGIFQASSPSSFGGFYRYPEVASEALEGYSVPVIFVFDGEKDLFQNSLITVFLQTDSDIRTLATELEQASFPKMGCTVPMGRTASYSYILGLADHMITEYGEMSISSLLQAIRDGNVWKDFYSSVLIPLFAALILVIVAISVYSIVWDIMMGRSREIAILRSIGMTKQGTVCYLFAELAVFISVFLGLGMMAGGALHYLLVMGMNAYRNTKIPLGFHASSYVASVTPNPWLYAAAVIAISSVAAIVRPLFRMSKNTPIALFGIQYKKKEKQPGRHFTEFSGCTWKRVISRHVRFHDTSVLVIMGIIMCAAFFGYNYFRAFTDKENVEYANELSEEGLDGWDFAAEKSTMFDPYTFLIENHHDSGVDEETYNLFAKKDFIKTAFARIVNKSTRLAYPENDVPDAVNEMMDPFSLLQFDIYETSENDYERTEYEAEKAMLEQIGYKEEEDIYALPTIGILPEEFSALSPYVTDGKIDLDKIKTGEEAVLVVPTDMQNVAEEAFHAGDELPLSDIELSEKEDSYSFFESLFDYADPVYLKYVEDPSSGAIVRYITYAFGKRKDIHTKIGAVVVLDDEKLYERYLLPCQELAGYGSEDVAYAPCLLGTPDTFSGWGLPDHLFTETKFSIADQNRLSDANASFYETIGTGNLTFASSFEIKEKMKENAGNTMTIYYVMIIMLIFLGMLAVGIKFYSRIKLNSQTIARLRAIGMSLSQIEALILRQNVLYPLIGGAVSFLPTLLCEVFFRYIKKQVDLGAWGGVTIITDASAEMPWYHNVPFRYSLFGYHPIIVILTIVIVFEILMLIATIPQIRYMRKQKIAEVIDKDSF